MQAIMEISFPVWADIIKMSGPKLKLREEFLETFQAWQAFQVLQLQIKGELVLQNQFESWLWRFQEIYYPFSLIFWKKEELESLDRQDLLFWLNSDNYGWSVGRPEFTTTDLPQTFHLS